MTPDHLQLLASVATLLSVLVGGGLILRTLKQEEHEEGKREGLDYAALAAAVKNAESAARAANSQVTALRNENNAGHDKIHARIDRVGAETSQQIKLLPCTDMRERVKGLETRLNGWERHDLKT